MNGIFLIIFFAAIIGFVYLPIAQNRLFSGRDKASSWQNIATKSKQSCSPLVRANAVMCENDALCRDTCLEPNTKCMSNVNHAELIPEKSVCVPFLDHIRRPKCSPLTGDLILTAGSPAYDYMCKCKNPGIMTQSSPHGDCDVPVACAPHGVLESFKSISNSVHLGKCKCNSGYVSDYVFGYGPICSEQTAGTASGSFATNGVSCPDGQLMTQSVINLNPLNRDSFVVDKHSRCLVDPCSVDPVGGSLSPHCRMVDFRNDKKTEKVCRCDPSFGYFPTYSSYSMINGDPMAPSGCMNIYEAPMPNTQFAELCSFKSTKGDVPQCTLVFKNVKLAHLSPAFKNAKIERNQIEIKDIRWPHTFTNILNGENKLNYSQVGLISPKNLAVSYFNYAVNQDSSSLKFSQVVQNIATDCFYLSAVFAEPGPVAVKNGIPKCGSEIMSRLHNKATLFRLTPVSRNFASRADDDYYKREHFEYYWQNVTYMPYCVSKSNFILANPYIVLDPAFNNFVPTVTVLTNEGLQNPVFEPLGSYDLQRLPVDFSLEIDTLTQTPTVNATWSRHPTKRCLLPDVPVELSGIT